MLDIELGLYLQQHLNPDRNADDTWTLLGGYPFGAAFGDVTDDEARARVARARHYLWDRRRHHEWRRSLTDYLTIPEHLRGFDFDEPSAPPRRRQPARAAGRFEVYDRVLSDPPPFARTPIPIAGAGEHTFPVGNLRYSVRIPKQLLTDAAPTGHQLDDPLPGNGEPVEVRWSQLKATADTMDAIENDRGGKLHQWRRRLDRVELRVRDRRGQRFASSADPLFRIDGLLNMAGMVGAGKSTVRDILTYWAVTQADPARNVTLVVGDVAEVLAIVELFTNLGVDAAPVLGHSTRERNLERLHRRQAGAGADSMLAHDHVGFQYLSSACALDALRGSEETRPLRIREAPCMSLLPARGDDHDHGSGSRRDTRHVCPLYSRCPRHIGSRNLITAKVWVATPAGLVHSGLPNAIQPERIRYLELACRRSDLIIVDEADRVQMQLDTAFAPAMTLRGGNESWIDEVSVHKIGELIRGRHLQLVNVNVDEWNTAINTVQTAADKLFALLIDHSELRSWITEDYFSAFTLHRLLIDDWFATADTTGAHEGAHGAGGGEALDRLEFVQTVLNRYRDQPLRAQRVSNDPDPEATEWVNRFVNLTLEILQSPRESVQDRLTDTLTELLVVDTDAGEKTVDAHVLRFEFTLVLAALHHSLDRMTILWTQVEPVLHLEGTSNVMSRRPPKDYEPILPESPMGNILGFQFHAGDGPSGELRFFRCNGVGRELLLSLHRLGAVDSRPGPHVMLMSATSWAGTSTRYHVYAPVDVVLRPHADEVAGINKSSFRTHLLYWPGNTGPGDRAPIRLSGTDSRTRSAALVQMLNQLALPDRSLSGGTSVFDEELADIEDPERRRILVLVGSYDEAKRAFDHLNNIPQWKGRVTRLISDDADVDDYWMTLRRGEVATFADTGASLLIAPLLAVERGHNIVVTGGKAAIGSVFFLARPHPRPDDITLAIQAINDWAVRGIRGSTNTFDTTARRYDSPNDAGLAYRRAATKQWVHFLTRRMAWSSLRGDEQIAAAWDQLVVIWQVIGRLVRGGEAARVVFVDAAFAPRAAEFGTDTAETSLLVALLAVLQPYFDENSDKPSLDRSLVTALYEPLYLALGLLQDPVTVSVTRPDWPVWS
ncbi:pPIWI_RE_Z domain-containing protein [Nocardia aurantia]|uniref:pPIWI-RE three-gene island domain-containing protein n=1 Tax=Nocardia aurantia TaxID=2585199 RepID=A0A7K0E1R1_9NOCA|nr:hypothetical protein [Nocardia aurantia]MQY32019.1 hypothetical protein [Nocardia aurantia]